ncbi:probable multidrug resistance-associated protein lethal(2)03659 isoform X2 [Cylas formicarius]|uniref:probable multidrug resistance-associated protein lethal(2)03659 isoform X2 n=1 Tax=Cylas formicarius TaxID=197179 RepID=UPI0029589B8B|nr:probable multidrug resistance-associated protein lethal(2)03659 isoform X2 [Cylas formicarius]
MDGNLKKNRKPNPRENAFPFSAVTFCYTIPTFIRGFKRDLEEQDLTETLSEHKSARLGNEIERCWREEEQRALKSNRSPSLNRVLIRVFGLEFLFYGIVLFLSEAIRINQPIFLGNLVSFFTPPDINYPVTLSSSQAAKVGINDTASTWSNHSIQSQKEELVQPLILGPLLRFYMPNEEDITLTQAYWYAAGVVFCSLTNILISHPYMLGVLHFGMKLRVACCSLIYRKSLRLSKAALGETTAGQVVNLLSNDVNRFDVAVLFVHQLWLGPLETIICTYLMYLHVGVSAAIGVLVLIFFVPLQIYLGKRISTLRLKTALRTDERVRLMNEIICGIQVIKMYAWEIPFATLVSLARRYEIKAISKSSLMRGIYLGFIMYSTRMAIFASILAYVLFGNYITAEKVFVLTSFYNILRQTMTVFFPQGISQVAEAAVSIRRLNKFMLYEETEIAKAIRSAEIAKNEKDEKYKFNGDFRRSHELGISLKNATARWSESSLDNTLTNITLQVTPGRLLAVIGPVGAGKSSLLHAILQELPLTCGSLEVNGEISYASQEPWLFAGSVRQNILFGLPMDKDRYRTVVQKCALERDFQLLPYGDKTIVGDRGVSLSGGQRARINLARAVYKEADIYLLDDPLSAVDTHVGKELFEQCIAGFLRNNTVVLVTHQLQYLKEVDHILFLENGICKIEGSYRDLQKSGLDFTNLLSDAANQEEEMDNIENDYVRKSSIKSISSVEVEAPRVVEEQKGTGSVGGYVYKAYFKAGGNFCTIFIMFVLFVVAQLFGSASDYFLTYWVNLEQQDFLAKNLSKPIFNLTSKLHNDTYTEGEIVKKDSTSYSDIVTDFWHFSRETSIYIYTGIIILLVIFTLVRSCVFFAVCMKASTNLHDNMFSSITRATMRFFNTNSGGRILNRFSKDMGAIDELLPSAMVDVLQIGLTLVGIIVVVAIVSPYLLIPTVAVGVIFYFMRIFYLRTSRNIKRLEGVTKSPVFSHLNATLQGLTTIRAFGAQEILIREFDNHQDLHSSAWYSFISTSRAFGYWLDLVCILYIAMVTFSFLVIGNEKFGGNVGLAITQAIGLTGMFQWGMRQSAELENQMTSVERVVEYTDVEHEPDLESSPDRKPPSSWPRDGRIEFKHVYLRYFPNDPPVLKNLNFTIQPKEKVGIVGRTGAGKSSLINAIFQLTETSGLILIDDVDIASIGLHDLRSKVSIIPQEPVLFSGTMRKNLDPFNEYTDEELWRALEAVELKEVVQDLMSGLNSKMSEGGSNFSVGQRQLVCLARAILRNNKILVLDEATANVDPQTDALIQQTIRRKFNDCTVLTIAHRLHTVMDSDKVLVMDAGTMKEFDHPFNLLQNKNGVLYSMVQKTGKGMSEALFEVAKESFDKLHVIQRRSLIS